MLCLSAKQEGSVYWRLFVGIERSHLHALTKGEPNEDYQKNARAEFEPIVAALRETGLANRRPPMQFLITAVGSSIAAVCSRCQSQPNYEFHHEQDKTLGERPEADGVS